MIIPVLLSGGIGLRLWPLSTPSSPKQFLRIFGQESLIQSAARRVMGMEEAAPPLVITGRSMLPRVREHLEEIGCVPTAVLSEPQGRNTAPAAMAAALWADPDDLLLGLPTDHLIADPDGFRAAVRGGIPSAQEGQLVVFGIEPSRPHTGFGYMQIIPGPDPQVLGIRRFVEKPDEATAHLMVESGEYLWNAGMFLARAGSLRKVMTRLLPKVADQVAQAYSAAIHQPDGTIELGEAFEESPSVSVAKGLWEQAEQVKAVRMVAGWSDIGSWAALGEALGATGRDNLINGTALVEDGLGVQIHSQDVKTAVVGVSDVVVVVANGRVLVAGREAWDQTGKTAQRLEDLT